MSRPLRAVPTGRPAPLPPASLDPWVTPQEIAAELRVARMTVYRLIESGELRHTRVGRIIRVRRSWFDAYLRSTSRGGRS